MRSGRRYSTRAAGLALGFVLDRTFGDPTRFHPVAGFGTLALAAERRLLDRRVPGSGVPGREVPSRDHARSACADRAVGVAFTAGLVGGAAAATALVDRAVSAPRSSVGNVGSAGSVGLVGSVGSVAWNAVVVWACLGGTSLLGVAGRQAELLESDDVPGSRHLLPWMCGRDPAALDREGLDRAVVESVAENTSDAAVATLVWAAVAGAPGVAAHRAANTLDAMVGHRSDRYRHFGWSAARLDDVLGFVPARVAGLLGVVLAPTVGGSASDALRAWRRDARAHPSPNAGVVESVCAGALGVRLGGRTPYPYGVQHRAVLGDGREVRAGDIRRAVRLHSRVQQATAVLAVLAVCVVPAVWRRRS